MSIDDYRYTNPPLVEVSAELTWELKELAGLSYIRLDGGFDDGVRVFTRTVEAAGFTTTEDVSDGMPVAMRGGQPALRFRTGPNKWPVYLLGPGFWGVNAIPPYDGWADFRRVIAFGLDALKASYSESDQKLKQLSLRFVNAFDARHGFEGDPWAFMTSALALKLAMKPESRSAFDSAVLTPQYQLTLEGDDQARRGVISVGVGKVAGRESLIADLAATRSFATVKDADAGELLAEFDAAYVDVRRWFEGILTDELRSTFGLRKEI